MIRPRFSGMPSPTVSLKSSVESLGCLTMLRSTRASVRYSSEAAEGRGAIAALLEVTFRLFLGGSWSLSEYVVDGGVFPSRKATRVSGGCSGPKSALRDSRHRMPSQKLTVEV